MHQQLEVLVFLLQEQIKVLPVAPCAPKCMFVQKESTTFSKPFMDVRAFPCFPEKEEVTDIQEHTSSMTNGKSWKQAQWEPHANVATYFSEPQFPYM